MDIELIKCQNFRFFGTSYKIYFWFEVSENCVYLYFACSNIMWDVCGLYIFLLHFRTLTQALMWTLMIKTLSLIMTTPMKTGDGQFLLWIKKWKHEGHSEQSASSCPQNAKVQLIFSWIEVEITISTYISQKWKCQFDHGWQDRNIKVRNDSCLWCLPHGRLTIIMSG